jgi:hypothetical protein
MIRCPGELLLDSVDLFSRYAQTLAFPDRYAGPVPGKRRAAEQVEGANFLHQPLAHAGGSYDGGFISFHPNMFIGVSMGHKLTNFFHVVCLL